MKNTVIRSLLVAVVSLALCAWVANQARAVIVTTDLIQDLDADVGVTAAGTNVSAWANQGTGGDNVATNSGSPQLVTGAVNGHNAISFTSDRMAGSLTNFDANISGSGYTWFAVVNPDNNPGTKNNIFGTLENGGIFSGQTAGVGNPSNSAYAMYREGTDQFTTGASQDLHRKGYHILSGRLAAGTGSQLQEVFVNGVTTADASGNVNVSGTNNAGPISIGSERTGGGEFFDGDVARILIYDRPLSNAEMIQNFDTLSQLYNVNPAAKTAPTFLSWSFENGLADDQTGTNLFTSLSGTAFESEPVLYSNTDASNPFGGNQFFVRTDYRADQSPNKPGDGPQGVMESGTFIIPNLGMLLVEAAGAGGMIELVNADNDATLLSILPSLTSVTLSEFDTDISMFAGIEAYLRITDNSSGGWGHIAIDNIVITGNEFVVPEPNSIALWCLLGGCFFALRKFSSRRKRT